VKTSQRILGGVLAVGIVAVVAATSRTGGAQSAPTSSPVSSAAVAQAYQAKHAEAAREAEMAFNESMAKYTSGQGTLEEAIKWSERARDASWGRGQLADHRDRLLKLEKAVQKKVASGAATKLDEHVIAYARALAEASAP
jgi:vacuolar-type H+-ATPase catalytic subunit A/Vma1